MEKTTGSKSQSSDLLLAVQSASGLASGVMFCLTTDVLVVSLHSLLAFHMRGRLNSHLDVVIHMALKA